MKKNYFIIRRRGKEYHFDMKDEYMAWYDFDHVKAECDGTYMEINADRDAYCIYIDKHGKRYYGVIKDDEHNVLPDNDLIIAGYTYHYVRCSDEHYI